MSQLTPYRYSYSGADTKVFARLSGYPETLHQIESVHTVSASVHEAKGQARALGYRGIKGISRGVRTIAGSMILTIVEDHPLRQLMIHAAEKLNEYRGGWSMDQNDIGTGTVIEKVNHANRLAELLPPIDILLFYVAEGGGFSASTKLSGTTLYAELAEFSGAGMVIEGIDFVDSGMVTSVNDIVSEITLSFLARDFKPISLNKFEVGDREPGWEVMQAGELRRQHSELEKVLYGDFGRAMTDAQRRAAIASVGVDGLIRISGGPI
jgi:hypothetical protein